MMRKLCLGVVAWLTLAAVPRAADAANYIVYAQGRGWGSWNGQVANVSGWTNVTLTYDGNDRLNSDATNVTLKNAIATYCAGANSCIIQCYSAGCLRTLKAVSDLRAAGNTLPGLMWGMATSSAAGGTKLADTATKGGTSLIAKLFGQQEKIDYDLTIASARNTLAYLQDDFSPRTLYHTMGNRDICKSIVFFKLCGNPTIAEGVGDGAVGMASGGGYSTQGSYTSGCNSGKYPGRAWENKSPCGGEPYDHFGMPTLAKTIIDSYTGYMLTHGVVGDNTNPTANTWTDSAASTKTACTPSSGTNGGCDNMFTTDSTNRNPADYSKTTSLTPVATDVSAQASDTTYPTSGQTCKGKCGGTAYDANGAVLCRCDSSCGSRGDCCADYATAGTGSLAANCPTTLAQ